MEGEEGCSFCGAASGLVNTTTSGARMRVTEMVIGSGGIYGKTAKILQDFCQSAGKLREAEVNAVFTDEISVSAEKGILYGSFKDLFGGIEETGRDIRMKPMDMYNSYCFGGPSLLIRGADFAMQACTAGNKLTYTDSLLTGTQKSFGVFSLGGRYRKVR